MKLLIHDLTASEWEKTADDYRNCKVISDTGTIRPCIGCFHCWTGGKGECIFKDGYGDMGALIHDADEVIVMSRYTYGGFSSFVKNVFDRSLGYVLPEFEVAYGEMHHKKRYLEDKPVTFHFRGRHLSAEDKKKASEYVFALCRNLRGSVKEIIFEECGPEKAHECPPEERYACSPEEEPGTIPEERPERSGILLINCSLRGIRSNTGVFLKKLAEGLKTPYDTVSLSSADGPEEIAEAIRSAETVVMGIPLYVDGIPASALRLMEKVKASGAGDGCRLYAVVNNGLYESRQNIHLLRMIKAFCAENGFIYRGAAAIGAGEAVGTLMRDSRRSLRPARNAESCLARLTEAVSKDRDLEDIYADPSAFPRWLYILIANTNWQRLKRADRPGRRQRSGDEK